MQIRTLGKAPLWLIVFLLAFLFRTGEIKGQERSFDIFLPIVATTNETDVATTMEMEQPLLQSSEANAPVSPLVNTFIAFGPQNYLRESGGPNIFTNAFSAVNPGSEYTLQIFNGGQSDQYDPIYDPISSAVVTLNGVQVVAPNDFNQQVTFIEKPVILTSENVLEVELRSKVGSGFTLQIIGIARDLPIITATVDPLPNEAGWHNTIVTVTFECSGGTGGIVSCPAPQQVLTEGQGLGIPGTAVDGVGNSATVTMTLNIDKTAPDLTSTINPLPNTNGWHNTDVTITYQASDALSGVADVSQPVTLMDEGADQSLTGTATDIAGNGNSIIEIINIDKSPPSITNRLPTDGAILSQVRPTISADFADALSGVDAATVVVTLDGADITGQSTVTVEGITFMPGADLTDGMHTVTVMLNDLSGNPVVATTTFTVQAPAIDLPPDPVDVAPSVAQTVATDLFAATEFLYTGADPIQTGVAPGTIDPERVAVLRGVVRTRAGVPLAGVVITVLDHPEFGQTLSRNDGMFDLAVNGGGNGGEQLTINYEVTGYLPAQRQISAPRRNFAWLPDVRLVPFDTQVTTVDLTSAADFQVARGGAVTDSDGTRQATLLFAQGTQAELVLPDGNIQSISTLNVRATEYTVGDAGPEAMPAALPPQSGYTYAVEFSVDEAVALNAAQVRFDRPVSFYLENFLGFPVGGAVPVGFYDRGQGKWIASDNGRVIAIVSITDGRANIDINGDGSADDATALGVTDAERAQLATLYTPGQSLWRVPITHFTPWDCNWPYVPPLDAEDFLKLCREAGGSEAECQRAKEKLIDESCEASGSIIGCQNQTLSEIIDLLGTSFTLNYASDRTPGRISQRTVEIPLSPSTVPASLERIELIVEIAGQQFTQEFPAAPNQSYTFVWDGMDAYQRILQGSFPAFIQIGYVYKALYTEPANFSQSFGRLSDSNAAISGNRSRNEVTFWTTRSELLSYRDERGQGLGGWTLDAHHNYDPTGQVLYRGDGTQRSAAGLPDIITTVAGTGVQGFSGEGGAATAARLHSPVGMAFGPDGALYFADRGNQRIRRIAADGAITTVAGNGVFGYSGDGGPATQAQLFGPTDVDFGPDGSLYIADRNSSCVRRVRPDGIITTFAGICLSGGSSGDGGPANQARLSSPSGVSVGPDGSVYIADTNNHRIRRVDIDGIITTVAGNGVGAFSGDGGLAVAAALRNPRSIDMTDDGVLYIADTGNGRIRRVRPDGTIMTVAGIGTCCYSGDGGPATQAQLRVPAYVAVSPDGAFYIADQNNHRIRRVGPEGIITTVAGNGSYGYSGDGGPAPQAQLNTPEGVGVGADGNLYVADATNARIRKLIAPLPGFTGSAFTIASSDGDEVYQFDAAGRHLRTFNALTGAIIYDFGYGADGLLTTITDGDNNVTTIERDLVGKPTAIVGPFGQRTTLGLNPDGYLATITDPASQAFHFTYHPGGLLATERDPRNNQHSFTYDAEGRLVRDDDPANGFTTLERVRTGATTTITRRTAQGRVTTYVVEELPNGDTRRVTTSPTGAQVEALTRTDGTQRLTLADGTVVESSQAPDPRWGVLALTAPSSTVTTPSGLAMTRSAQRQVTVADPNDLLSLQTLTDSLLVNGRSFTSVFDAATRTLTRTSPEGRQTISRLDAQGRVTEVRFDATLDPVVYTYDAQGRVERVTRGSHFWSYAYDERGRVASISDAVGTTVVYTYDDADRVVRKQLPSLREFEYTYNANGNLTGVFLPSGAAHELDYTALNQDARYTPPGSTSSDLRTYDLDRALNLITMPSGRVQDYSYDSNGRPTGVSYPEATITVNYGDSTDRVQTLTRTPIIGAAQSLVFGYDGGLVTTMNWSGAANGNFAYTYDNNFFLTGITLDGAATPISRDNDGLLTGYGPFAFTRGGPAGSLSRIQDSTLAVDLSYDSLWRLANRSHTVGGQAVYSLSLDYENVGLDNIGRARQKTETVLGITHIYTYRYDPDGQLIEVQRDGVVVESYLYDDNGNRTNTLAGVATYDSRDLLTNLGGNPYQFDSDGFLTQRGGDLFQYSARGELLQVALAGGESITYAYDGMNRRVSRTDSAGTTQYLYGDPGNPFQITHVREAAGALTTLYYDEAGHLYAFDQSGVHYYVATDQVGTPRVVTDAAGAVIKVLEYDSYGVLQADSNPGFALIIGFAGGLMDAETGLVRFGWRDYDPAAGRWTARDPVLFDGGQENLYVYVRNDPVNLRDPFGLWCIGGSLYALFGGGGEFCWTDDGISICAEIGLGVGASVGGSSGDLARDGSEVGAELEASCFGVIGGKIGITLTDCGDLNPILEGGIGSLKISPDKLGLSPDVESRLSEKFQKRGAGSGKCGIGGKIAAKKCARL